MWGRKKTFNKSGSSPRLRGTLDLDAAVGRVARFIPAPAGDTGDVVVYPPPAFGSSPRLRGTLVGQAWVAPSLRFIPAPAGDTPSGRACRRRRPVHPRACGGHPYTGITGVLGDGSSPRLRGTLSRARRHQCQRRFIPAPAGDTIKPQKQLRARPVHPRACGGHCAACGLGANDGGSSPRLRGTPHHLSFIVPRERFIPAPAGDTPAHRELPTADPVHPRACGGHCSIPDAAWPPDGSSPRLRGTPRPRGRRS